MKVKGKSVHVTTNIEAKAKQAFKAIKMHPPEKILFDEYTAVVEKILH